jgi:uncharacterized protein
MKLDLDRQGPGCTLLDVDERLPTGAPAPLPSTVGLHGRLTVDNLESRVLVTGLLAGDAVVVCDRCLEDFTCGFETVVEIVVLRDPTSDEGELDSWVIHERSAEVDLDESLREAALLGLPLKFLCADTCRGLCPHCGANRNRESCACAQDETDSRWDELPGR